MRCEKCDVEVKTQNWSKHLKSKTRLKNDPDQNLKPLGHTKVVKNLMYKLHLAVG